jgi:hypothetical protein
VKRIARAIVEGCRLVWLTVVSITYTITEDKQGRKQ